MLYHRTFQKKIQHNISSILFFIEKVLNNTIFEKEKNFIKRRTDKKHLDTIQQQINKIKMTESIILTQFSNLFTQTKKSLDDYINNYEDEVFVKGSTEDNEKAYKRGESKFNHLLENIDNLDLIIQQEQQFLDFFSQCKRNRKLLTDQRNNLIDDLSNIKKEMGSVKEWEEWKKIWDKKRDETDVVKMRRETQEMLEEISKKEESIEKIKQEIENEKNELMGMKNDLEKIIEKAKKEKEEFNVKEEFEKVAEEYVKKNDFDYTMKIIVNNENNLANSMNDLIAHQTTTETNYIELKKNVDKMEKNYVNKNDFEKFKITEKNSQEKMNQIIKDIGITVENYETKTKEEFEKVCDEFVKKNDIPETLKELKNLVNKKHIDQLEEWTSLKCSEVLFDSNIDDWAYETSVFNDRIVGKKQLTFLIENEDDEIFGYYSNTKLIKLYRRQETDSKSFHFNLQTKNNRINQSMKFKIKDSKNSGIWLWKANSDYLIKMGDIYLFKENMKNESSCLQHENAFNYQGIENALCGKIIQKENNKLKGCFTPKRIIVIQMK